MIEANKCSVSRFKEKMKKVIGNDNKMGKKSFVEIRPGQLAAFLLKDIIALQPTVLDGVFKGRDKVTGLNYSILTAELAMYNTAYHRGGFDKLKVMFAKAHLIGECANPHPFLEKVFEKNPRNTVDFYISYMECRLDWLNSRLKSKDFKSVNILKPERIKWMKRDSEYYKNLAKRYLSQPIELPRCLFEDSIVDKMIEISSNNENLQELKQHLEGYKNKKEGVRFNVTYLIMKYHEAVKNDRCQRFYGWDRGYKIIDTLEGTTCYRQINFFENYDYKKSIDKYLNELKIKQKNNEYRVASKDEKQIEERKLGKYKKELNDNERVLRRLKVQDILLFYMAKNIIGEKVDNFKMKTISPHKEEGILELQIPFSMKISFTNGGEKIIYQDSIKIKNYGDFFCYLYDGRVKTLLPQIEKIEINREELDRELMNYDLARPYIFRLILDFERTVNMKHPEMLQERHGFTDLLNKLNELDVFSSRESEDIRLIRNAFSHNEYPQMEIINKNELPDVIKGVKELFLKDIGKIKY